MKRFLFFTLLVCTGLISQAQESVAFKHLAIGINAGSNGLGVDLATTLSKHLEARVGWDAMSRFTTTTHLYTNELSNTGNLMVENGDYKIDFQARSNMKTGKVLLDIFPSKKSSFRFTIGAYYCTNEKVAQATNSNYQEELMAIYQWNQENPNEKIGVSLGEYLLEPNEDGTVHATFNVKRIQPYVGIGFGHVVPKKKRVSVSMDLGIKYWGKPDIYCNGHIVPESNMNGSNHKVLKLLSNLSVWPVLNIRLAGRIF